MAAIWVSNSGCGTSPKRSTKISMSCRAAWNTFSTAWLASSVAKRGEIEVRRLRVDHRDLVVAGELHDTELRPVGALAHELGIDGDEFLGRQTVAEGCSASVVAIREGGGNPARGGRGIGGFYTAGKRDQRIAAYRQTGRAPPAGVDRT